MATEKMTISQVNRRISKLKGKLKDVEMKAAQSVTFREEQSPAYEFNALVEQAKGIRSELEQLEAARTLTNATTQVQGAQGMTLTQAVIHLAELKGQIAWYQGLNVKAREETAEPEFVLDADLKRHVVQKKMVCRLPEAKRQAVVDSLQDEFDRLNNAVETADHQTMVKM